MSDLGDIPDVDILPDVWIVVPAIALLCISACVGLRFYVRKYMLKAVGIDDWLLLAAYVVTASHCILFMSYGGIVKYQGGLKANFDFAYKVLEFQALVYGIAQVLVKAALSCFFLRVLTIEGWQRITIISVLSIYCIFTTAYTFILLFQCGNPLYLGLDAACLDLNALNTLTYFSAAFNAATDWILTLVPMIVIMRSMMSRNMKIPIFCIFGLGVLGSVISIVRIPYILDGVIVGTLDGFRNCLPFQMMSLWENITGIMALSLAALRPLVTKVFKLGTTASTDATGGAPSSLASEKPDVLVSSVRVDLSEEAV